MEDTLRRILVAGLFVAAVALAVPAGASAWTPEDCAAVHWDHPDCVNVPRPQTTVCFNGVTQQVPADMPPEGSTPGECVPPVETTPPPPVDTTPPVVMVPPIVVDVPPVDVPPVDTPNVVPTPVAHAHPHPNQVEGKEQQKPGSGGHIGTPVSVAGTETSGPTLPFTGLGLLPLVLAGAALSLVGFAGYRALRT